MPEDLDHAPRIAPLPGQLALPSIEPEGAPTRSRALIRVWEAGRDAALGGLTIADCPYPRRKAGRLAPSLRRSRCPRRFWLDGFQSVALFPMGGSPDGEG